jgi:hypothetical protein
MAAWCRDVILPVSIILGLTALNSIRVNNTGTTPIVDHVAPSLAANASAVIEPVPIAVGGDTVAATGSMPTAVSSGTEAVTGSMPTAVGSGTEAATGSMPTAVGSGIEAATGSMPIAVGSDTGVAAGSTVEPAQIAEEAPDSTPAPHELVSTVTLASAETTEILPLEVPPERAVTSSVAVPEPVEGEHPLSLTEILSECFVMDACVDRYLWALYLRTPKEDTIRENHQRKVTVKKKGKSRTVTKNFTTLVDEDFAWKDGKAAGKVSMAMMDYVIGGVDRSFRLRLFHMLYAAEEAGLSPGITSAFRDDYRQSIASGLKAANDRSYHGGSLRGGYGHGLAADVVSIGGQTRTQRLASTELLWKWIDAHGDDFGIGRPYLDRDPPHLAPIDGKEYADHSPSMKARLRRALATAESR